MSTMLIASLSLLALAAALFFFGTIFGMVIIPSINEKLGIACILIPILVAPVCLYHYKKTQVASRLLIAGMVTGLAALGCWLQVQT